MDRNLLDSVSKLKKFITTKKYNADDNRKAMTPIVYKLGPKRTQNPKRTQLKFRCKRSVMVVGAVYIRIL